MSRRQQEPKYVLLKKHGTYRNEEDKDVGSSRQGRQKSRSSFQHNFERGGDKPEPPHLQDSDGNEGKRDVQEVRQVKDTQNTICDKRMALPSESHVQVTMRRDRKPPEGEVGQNTQDGSLKRWFKVTIPGAMNYDKIWLMKSIVSHCRVPLTPVDFHYSSNLLRFFVQGASAASALRDVSCKIFDKRNQKIFIFVDASTLPYSVRDKLKPKEMEQLKLTISKRYDVSKKAIDLRKLRYDPDLEAHNVEITLNRRNCMSATLQIIKENFPELLSLKLCRNRLSQLNCLCDLIQMIPTVQILDLSMNQLNSVCELHKIKELKLEELWLYGNPLCSTFPDHSTYISAIRKYFPKLLRLDGQVLPPPITVDIDRYYLTQPWKPGYKGPDILRTIVLPFLQKYYLIYDYGDRGCLSLAYHHEACFSLTIPFSPKNPAPGSLCKYFKNNRNMKILKDPSLRVQQLKHTKHDIVCSLCMLPKTQHDFSSFMVDMWFQTKTMLFFSVNGVFKEVEGMSYGSLRAFSRTFLLIPASDSSIIIMNDELFVRDIAPQKTQSTIPIPVHMPMYSSLLTLSREQRDMLLAFSTQSGMKLLWSQKCLQQSQWNYVRAAQVFIMLKTNGWIPMEAFKEIP